MQIEHIDQILPVIAGKEEFIVAERQGYRAIDYRFVEKNTFDHPMLLECRGIKFYWTGKIMARPFHKFFNLGERPDTMPDMVDFSQPHTITHKLDGSMIHPAIVGDELVFMTRMGRTDVALKAEELLTPSLASWCRDALDTGLTPIFEYTSPKQRIVIRYDDSKLTLLAVRNTVNGQYLDISGYKAPGVDCIARVSPEWLTARSFMDFVAAILGAEGFVVTFENGLWVKAKGMDYVLKHKSKEGIHLEKNALALIITGALDDVLPLLDAEDATAVQEYAASVHAGMKAASRLVEDLVDSGSSLSQKEFAVDHLHGHPDWLKPLAFQVRAGKEANSVVADAVLKKCGAQSDVDKVRDIFRADWRL